MKYIHIHSASIIFWTKKGKSFVVKCRDSIQQKSKVLESILEKEKKVKARKDDTLVVDNYMLKQHEH